MLGEPFAIGLPKVNGGAMRFCPSKGRVFDTLHHRSADAQPVTDSDGDLRIRRKRVSAVCTALCVRRPPFGHSCLPRRFSPPQTGLSGHDQHGSARRPRSRPDPKPGARADQQPWRPASPWRHGFRQRPGFGLRHDRPPSRDFRDLRNPDYWLLQARSVRRLRQNGSSSCCGVGSAQTGPDLIGSVQKRGQKSYHCEGAQRLDVGHHQAVCDNTIFLAPRPAAEGGWTRLPEGLAAPGHCRLFAGAHELALF